MSYAYPASPTLWLLVVPAALVLGLWAVLTWAGMRQRTFWVIAVPLWLLVAGASLVGVVGADSIYSAYAVLVSASAALLVLLPVSVIVADRRSPRP